MEKYNQDLDNLILRSLDLTEEKIVNTIQLENLVKDGHIEVAKSKYIQGRETIGMIRVPQDKTINTLFELETTMTEEQVPKFDIHMKKQEDIESCNPLKWFGVLVPQSLKTAQRKFQESIYLAAKIANITSELDNIILDFNSTKNKINKLTTLNVEE